jgi:hypothetical protein
LIELCIKASLIQCVQKRAKTKTSGERKNSTDAVDPVVVCSDDDAEQCERWVQQHCCANPFATREWPDSKRAP